MDEKDFNSWIAPAIAPICDTQNNGKITLSKYEPFWTTISEHSDHKWVMILTENQRLKFGLKSPLQHQSIEHQMAVPGGYAY